MFALGAALALVAAVAIAPHAGYTLSSTPVTVINSSVPVTVGNPIDPVIIAKAQGIQHPFTMQFGCTFPIQSNTCQTDITRTVPTTQRWVIESVGYSCNTDNTTLITATIVTVSPSVREVIEFPLPVPPPSTGFETLFFQSALNLRLYEDPGTLFSFEFATEVFGGTRGGCNVVISGQAIDVS
jgi:hypothetical protein